MMILLKFILIIFIAGVLFGGISIVRIVHRVRNMTDQFRKETEKQYRRPAGDDNNVVDHRSSEDANKKIIPKDEGDYVDYEDS